MKALRLFLTTPGVLVPPPAKKPSDKSTAAKKTAAKKSGAKRTATSKATATDGSSVVEGEIPENPVEYSYFAQARARASSMVNDPEALKRVAREAGESSAQRSGAFTAVVEDFRTLIRLVVAYARGHYRDIPTEQLVVVVAALIYVVSPVDLLPDMLPGGFLDDAFVVGWVIKALRSELDAFRRWEEGRS